MQGSLCLKKDDMGTFAESGVKNGDVGLRSVSVQNGEVDVEV